MLKRYGEEQNRKLHSMLKRYREGLSRETLSALTAVCFFRRTENLCRIAPKTEYERGMPRYPADDTRHIFLNLNRYGGEQNRKPHLMLKRYGGEYSRKLHSMLKRYGEGLSRETLSALTAVCFFRRTENLCRIAPKRNIDAVCPAILLTTQGTFLNLNRYGEGLSRKLHSMLKRYREGLSRETRTALTAVCFFRRTENLCRIAPKTEYERGMPRYPADDTRHIFLNLNRYGEGLSRKLHSMLKNYGER